jgi:hypothetical protein
MKVRIVFLICFACAGVFSAFAQSKTVTNMDLEKYRDERVKGEAYLRENYAKMGFSSPEERAKRIEQAAKETAELAERLRSDRLERERLAAEREAAERRAASVYDVQPYTQYSSDYFPYYDYWGGGYYWSGGRRFRRPFRGGFQQQNGYFAGGMFIPTGTPPRPGPAWSVPRVNPRR